MNEDCVTPIPSLPIISDMGVGASQHRTEKQRIDFSRDANEKWPNISKLSNDSGTYGVRYVSAATNRSMTGIDSRRENTRVFESRSGIVSA